MVAHHVGDDRPVQAGAQEDVRAAEASAVGKLDGVAFGTDRADGLRPGEVVPDPDSGLLGLAAAFEETLAAVLADEVPGTKSSRCTGQPRPVRYPSRSDSPLGSMDVTSTEVLHNSSGSVVPNAVPSPTGFGSTMEIDEMPVTPDSVEKRLTPVAPPPTMMTCLPTVLYSFSDSCAAVGRSVSSISPSSVRRDRGRTGRRVRPVR